MLNISLTNDFCHFWAKNNQLVWILRNVLGVISHIICWGADCMHATPYIQYWPFYYGFNFFYKKKRLNPFVHLLCIFFQYTDTQVHPENWKTLNSAILCSRVSNSISEWLNGPTGSRDFFLIFLFVYEAMFPKLWKVV